MPEAPGLALEALPPRVRDAWRECIRAIQDTMSPALVSAIEVCVNMIIAGLVTGQWPPDQPEPRSVAAWAVLGALTAHAPGFARAHTIATMVHLPLVQTRRTLQALALLGIIEHRGKGYDRYRPDSLPPPQEGGPHGHV